MANALSVAPAGSPIYSVQLYDQGLHFYLNRTVVLVDYRDELSLGLDQHPELGIADMTDFTTRWRRLTDGFAVMRPATYGGLQAQGLPMRMMARLHHRVVVSRR